MTRQDIAVILRPCWPGVGHALVPWCADLVCRHGWTVGLGGVFAARRRLGRIEVPGGLVSDADVGLFLHEAGHLSDPRDRPRLAEDFEPADVVVSLEAESYAWLFATSTAGRRWNRGMQDVLEACLTSYGRLYANSDADRRLIVDTIAYTRARRRERSVVSVRPRPPVPVPSTVVALLSDIKGLEI